MKIGIIPCRIENGKKQVLISRYSDIACQDIGEVDDAYWTAVLAAYYEFGYYYQKGHYLNIIYDDAQLHSSRYYSMIVTNKDVDFRCKWIDIDEARNIVPESQKFLIDKVKR
jgi:hypothetical protein